MAKPQMRIMDVKKIALIKILVFCQMFNYGLFLFNELSTLTKKSDNFSILNKRFPFFVFMTEI